MKSNGINIDFEFNSIFNANKVNDPVTSGSTLVLNGFSTTVKADTSGGIFTSVLPTAVGISGAIFNLTKVSSDSNTWTVQCDGVETINGSNTIPIVAQYTNITIQSDGTDWIVI
jgi:hypothetical protein